MSDVIWSIYRITNKINNKIYIGQSKDPKTRWSRHKSDARLDKNTCIHLHSAMKKYGIDQFEFEIIAQTKDINYVDDLEIFLIKEYNSSDREVGYNLSEGGQVNRLVSAETREKMSVACRGRKSWNKGKACSDETKKLISDSLKGRDAPWMKDRIVSKETKAKLSAANLGKKASEETKKKMSGSMIGKNGGSKNGMFGTTSEDNPCAKLTLIQAVDIRKEYSTGIISASKLAKKYNVSKKTILNILHNKIYVEKQDAV